MKKIVLWTLIMSLVTAIIGLCLIACADTNTEERQLARKYADSHAALFENSYEYYMYKWEETPESFEIQEKINRVKKILTVTIVLDHSYEFIYPIKDTANGRIDVGIEYGYLKLDYVGDTLIIFMASFMCWFIVISFICNIKKSKK